MKAAQEVALNVFLPTCPLDSPDVDGKRLWLKKQQIPINFTKANPTRNILPGDCETHKNIVRIRINDRKAL